MIHFKKLWKIHSWLGLYCGVFIAFLSITGALAVFKNEIDVLFNKELLRVTPAKERLSYDSLYEQLKTRAYARDTGLYVYYLHIPQAPDEAIYISCFKSASPGAGVLEKAKGYEFRQFFANPYTGAYLGQRDYYKSIAYFIRHVHVRFYDSFWGRPAAGIFGIGLFIIIVIGFIIYGRFIKEAVVLAIRKKNIRQLYADWHKLVGVLALFFNLMIALTGAWVGMQGYYMKWFNIKNPGTYKRESVLSKEQDKAQPLAIEEMLRQTTKEFPALRPAAIRVSSNGTRLAEVVGDVPGAVYETHRQKVTFDKASTEVLEVYDISKQGFGDKLYLVQEALHFGDFGGLLLKVFYCIFGLTTGFLSITGFYIYFKRKKADIKLPSVSPQPHTHLAFEGFQYAKEQGKGDSYSIRLFEAFFKEDKDIGNIEVLTLLAEETGLDPKAFKEALESRRYKDLHQEELQKSYQIGIQAVPTFKIGEQYYQGVIPKEDLKRILKAQSA